MANQAGCKNRSIGSLPKKTNYHPAPNAAQAEVLRSGNHHARSREKPHLGDSRPLVFATVRPAFLRHVRTLDALHLRLTQEFSLRIVKRTTLGASLPSFRASNKQTIRFSSQFASREQRREPDRAESQHGRSFGAIQ